MTAAPVATVLADLGVHHDPGSLLPTGLWWLIFFVGLAAVCIAGLLPGRWLWFALCILVLNLIALVLRAPDWFWFPMLWLIIFFVGLTVTFTRWTEHKRKKR